MKDGHPKIADFDFALAMEKEEMTVSFAGTPI